MESWRKVFRDGFLPLLTRKHLLVLQEALLSDDSRLIQGATTEPPPLQCVQDWPVQAACLLGFCAWQGNDLTTVAEVEEQFARWCFEIDSRVGEPAGCRWLLNFFDETPRQEVRRLLLEEVGLALGSLVDTSDKNIAKIIKLQKDS